MTVYLTINQVPNANSKNKHDPNTKPKINPKPSIEPNPNYNPKNKPYIKSNIFSPLLRQSQQNLR